jgi:hypothetical protein
MYTASQLNAIDTELAANGMRRATEDEAGRPVITSQGRVWATDCPMSSYFDTPMRVVTQFVKDVRYNRENRDWDAFVVYAGNEEYIGSRRLFFDAETLCDEYVHDQLMRQPARKAA